MIYNYKYPHLSYNRTLEPLNARTRAEIERTAIETKRSWDGRKKAYPFDLDPIPFEQWPWEKKVLVDHPVATPGSPAEPRAEGGEKFDDGKLRWDLLPMSMLHGVIRVLMGGARVHSDRNWAKGFRYSRLLNAAKRHIDDTESGRDIDPDFGELHIDHAICDLLFLRYQMVHNRYANYDDRIIEEEESND